MDSIFIIDKKIQKILVEIFSEKVQIPVGIYEKYNAKVKGLFPTKKHFADFCSYTTSHPTLSKYCENDHQERSFKTSKRDKQQCHFGLWNYCYPILINNNIRASLLFGQRLFKGEENNSKLIFLSACKKYNLDAETTSKLKNLFDQIKIIDGDYFDEMLTDVGDYFYEQIKSFYENFDEVNNHDRIFRTKVQRIAHEFLLPVQSITANSEILAILSKHNTELNEYALDIMMEMENLCLTAENLLSSVVLADEKYQFKSLNIVELIERCRLLFKRFAAKNSLDISVNNPHYRNINPIIEGSYDHLLRAFKNLFHNAIKYSYGNRFIRVDFDSFIDSMKISISNFGFQVHKYEYDLIFTDAYRGDEVRDLHRTGSGIGLSEVKRIIERHHGNIDISSLDEKSGYLTIFNITLPRKQKMEK